DAEVYYAKMDSVHASRNALLESESSSGKFIEPFREIEKKSFDYQMANSLMTYKTQASKEGKNVFPAKYDIFINKQNLNDESVSYLNEFNDFAQGYISQKAVARYYADPERTVLRYYEFQVDEVCNLVTSEKNKSIIISGIMPQLLKDVGTQ